MNLTLRCEPQQSSKLGHARGGAVEVAPGAFLSTRDTRFEGCTAREGGAVHGARGARLLFDSSTFADNVAERGGARGRKRSPIPSPPPRAYAAPERARGGGGRRARACASAAVTSTRKDCAASVSCSPGRRTPRRGNCSSTTRPQRYGS